MAGAVSRSRLADGRVVGWYGEPGIVIDAEVSRAGVPVALAARHGSDDFWARWTAAECRAKLADVPIAIWLRSRGLDGEIDGVQVSTWDDLLPGLTVSIAGPAV